MRIALVSVAGALLALGSGWAQPPATSSASATVPRAAPAGYTLVWADEFDRAGAPDPANWTYERGFVRNNELQFYQPQNATVRHGMLVIEARRESIANPNHDPAARDWRRARASADYTSSSLITRGLQAWQFGRFELRARIDVRPGLWPAWWCLGVEGRWPANGEIDIMEYYRGMLLANVAWASPDGPRPRWDTTLTPLKELGDASWAQAFHVWRMDWDKEAIRLYVDDRLLNETRLADTVNPDGSNPFLKPQYMILNVAVGGDNGGDPGKTEFPSRMEVDWVRVYQRAGG
ncbi:MAG TPA: glycoside hydrolase family 16 protein [Luteitalea sp.]|nr:glycoside hydrolase family 16 protein [Luteitalea sp.]